ncbi:hypothetical protein DPV78_002234 [Talaromyces pinophilus]|nr:hypothetical protein DPV78_002234 [Talaromyces pinophilus]
MPRPKRALSGIDPNIATPQEPASGKRKKVTTETSSPDNAASNAQSEGRDEIKAAAPRYIPIARPFWDIRAEEFDKEVDDDDESESSDAEDTETLRIRDDLDSPEWPWTLSSSAIDKYHELKKQAELRDQDMQGVYVYNDFTAYGVNEVVDNWLKDFHREVSRKSKSPYTVWAELEALSWFLQLDYTNIWFSGDDSHGYAETLALVGKALLTGIDILKTNKLFKPYKPEGDSGIRNIPTVLALFVQFAKTWISIGGDHYGETKWVSKVGKVARENGIEIKGPYKFHEVAEKMLKPVDENKPRQKKKVVRFDNGTWGIPKVVELYSDEDDMAIRDNGDYSIKGWKEAFEDYSMDHGKGPNNTIGGSSYDITKLPQTKKRLSQAKKKQYRITGF